MGRLKLAARTAHKKTRHNNTSTRVSYTGDRDFLPVICGELEGSLDLQGGMVVIVPGRKHLYTLGAFETLAGRGRRRNWRSLVIVNEGLQQPSSPVQASG